MAVGLTPAAVASFVEGLQAKLAREEVLSALERAQLARIDSSALPSSLARTVVFLQRDVFSDEEAGDALGHSVGEMGPHQPLPSGGVPVEGLLPVRPGDGTPHGAETLLPVRPGDGTPHGAETLATTPGEGIIAVPVGDTQTPPGVAT